MDGERIQKYWSNEIDSLITTYKQFELLIPDDEKDCSAHKGEDGRFVEDLISEYLKKYLPKSIEILTGFILRPAVKTGLKSKTRKDETDSHSTQLDIIIYNSYEYPIFQRFGNSVIVPPEGVLGIISVKKHLNDYDIKKESIALYRASKLCRTLDAKGDFLRGPFLALVSAKSMIDKSKTENHDWIFKKLKESYNITPKPYFDDLLGYIGSLDEWSIFKRRPNKTSKEADYIYFNHKDYESHLGLQYLLTGILSVFYDSSRNNVNRPGFTAFPSGRDADKFLGKIEILGLRK
ncbi:DUF6602 domain-containing protein [Marinilabilia salmonicolor]|uniref:DUF6602 domain-containing protein n=1 Tax=Marinilabilia salmonicolor TaxID=989 RepID=A0A368ULQ0_9BACT|nr:DUF6602 domain-containing protein [Marinilabilia salmonicolor]RCW29649.1 hypothetical protein DFO77_1266 [Marinilabilia salmonicolor]